MDSPDPKGNDEQGITMRIIGIFMAAAMLASCASNNRISDAFDARQNAGQCPPAGAVYNASRIVELEGEEAVYANIRYTGEVVGVRLFCRYADDDPVRAEVEIDFAFGRGSKGTERSHDFTYWVAVTRRSGKVLNKEYFTVRADFSDGDVVGAREKLTNIIIPRADSSVSAANFEVLVGFDLTEDQAQFNKDGRRFRLSAGQ